MPSIGVFSSRERSLSRRRGRGIERGLGRAHPTTNEHEELGQSSWPNFSDGDAGRLKIRSGEVTDGIRRAPARAMLRAVGMRDADIFSKPCRSASPRRGNEVTPCNLSIERLAAARHERGGVRRRQAFRSSSVRSRSPMAFSMGHEGMRASLVSREVIADSVETVMHAERFDGFVGLAGCDKSLPAMMMAAARIDVPMVFVYAGSIMPGQWRNRALDVVSVFEAVGEYAAGTISDEDLYQIEKNACPGEGACAGMFTANTMAAIGEALGLSLPTGASAPAVDRRRDDVAYDSGRAVVAMLEKGIRPRQILTKAAFENAIAVTMALGMAPPTPCCTCSRSPMKPRSSSPSMTSVGSASARRILPI